MNQSIIFVTHNKGKVASAQRLFQNSHITLETFHYDLDEPRSDDIKEIATAKVKQAYELVQKPCIALDTGFFIEALNGFPRAFVNFALDTIGIEGILKLMEKEQNRACYFGECLAFHNGKDIQYFEAKIQGTLSEKIVGKETEQKWSKLWYIFKPETSCCTLAELDAIERQQITDREEVSAMRKFVNWIENNEEAI